MELIDTIKDVQSAGLYADCQDGAEALISFIDEIKADCRETVRLLEHYYELLYKVSIGENNEACLVEHISKISDCIERESKPHRIEVAFITHKASMSDSIETIYYAAKADPDCDAYWIPVPYCERNASGLSEAAYLEGAEHYDASIDITDWREYDIEARHPDVIFMFSPYDATNVITSIHPNYYCEKLRNFTDLLVYVPYFVDIDDGTTDNYCLLPGCVFSHKAILSTGKMKDTYIRVFSQQYGNSFGKPEDKFVALGSPKYDKIINTKRTDRKLPPKWGDMIGDKKLVTYASSVGSLLETRGTYLGKLGSILETFRNRKDVLLWWRPHPLIEITLSTMLPESVAQYRETVETYKNEGWGIYDDTADLHRAIAWSDAYYGDWSSLLLLYQVAGKPVMLADTTTRLDRIKANIVHCRYEDKKNRLSQYIDDVVNDNIPEIGKQDVEKRIVNADGTAGKAIYEYAKRAVLN